MFWIDKSSARGILATQSLIACISTSCESFFESYASSLNSGMIEISFETEIFGLISI